MRTIALALTTSAVIAAIAAPGQGAIASAIGPHVYSTRIAGATPAVLNGTWRLAVKQPAFTVTKGGALAVAGSVRISGSRITFRDVAGPFACHGAQVTGVYAWRVSGTRLTLSAVSDRCVGRRSILTRPFTRIS